MRARACGHEYQHIVELLSFAMVGVPRLRGCACACSCVCRCVRGLTVTSITPAPLGVPRLRGCVRVFVGVCGYEYYASAYDAGCPKTPRVCVSLPRSLCTSLCLPHPLFVLVLLQIAPSQLRLPVLQLCLTLLEAPGPNHSYRCCVELVQSKELLRRTNSLIFVLKASRKVATCGVMTMFWMFAITIVESHEK